MPLFYKKLAKMALMAFIKLFPQTYLKLNGELTHYLAVLILGVVVYVSVGVYPSAQCLVDHPDGPFPASTRSGPYSIPARHRAGRPGSALGTPHTRHFTKM